MGSVATCPTYSQSGVGDTTAGDPQPKKKHFLNNSAGAVNHLSHLPSGGSLVPSLFRCLLRSKV